MPRRTVLFLTRAEMVANALSRFEALYIPEPNSGCWLWTGARARFGYGSFYFNRRCSVAHRVSWIIAGRDIPEGLQLCHRCDVPSCVNPEHLFLGTQAENTQDCFSKGRRNEARGERKPQAKLSDDEALAIFRDPRPQIELSRVFGVSKSVVGHIKTGRGWSHVTGKVLNHAS